MVKSVSFRHMDAQSSLKAFLSRTEEGGLSLLSAEIAELNLTLWLEQAFHKQIVLERAQMEQVLEWCLPAEYVSDILDLFVPVCQRMAEGIFRKS